MKTNEHFHHFLCLFCSSHFLKFPSPLSRPLLKLCHHPTFLSTATVYPQHLPVHLKCLPPPLSCHLQSFPSHFKVTSKIVPNPLTFRSTPTPLSNAQCFILTCDENKSCNRLKAGLDPCHKKIRYNGCDVKMQLSNWIPLLIYIFLRSDVLVVVFNVPIISLQDKIGHTLNI